MENYKLSQKTTTQRHTLDYLKKQKQQESERNKELKRNEQLNNGAVDEYELRDKA